MELSRAQVAEKTGKTVQAIGEYERGVSWPGAEALIGYLKMGADIVYILTGRRSGRVAEYAASYTTGEGALPTDERTMLDLYRGLSKKDRALIQETLNAFASKSRIDEEVG